MDGENTSLMSSLTICKRMEFEENSHVDILHRKMDLLSGRTNILQKLHMHSWLKRLFHIVIGLRLFL